MASEKCYKCRGSSKKDIPADIVTPQGLEERNFFSILLKWPLKNVYNREAYPGMICRYTASCRMASEKQNNIFFSGDTPKRLLKNGYSRGTCPDGSFQRIQEMSRRAAIRFLLKNCSGRLNFCLPKNVINRRVTFFEKMFIFCPRKMLLVGAHNFLPVFVLSDKK